VVDSRQTQLEDVNSRLKSLKNAAAGLRTIVASTTQTVESSLSGKVAAKLISGAGPGGYEIAVQKLASSEQKSYTYSQQATNQFLDVNGVQIEILADSDLATAVSTINANAASPVYAAAVDGKLVLSNRQTGAPTLPATTTFTVSGAMVSNEAVTKQGTDAEYTIDNGAVQTSKSNILTNAIAGVELTLKGTTAVGENATITVSAPPTEAETIKTKVKAFVEQYNSTVDFIRGKLSEKRVPNATTEADMKKGALFNDSGLSNALFKLRASIGEQIGGGAFPAGLDSLSDLGISTGGSTGSFSADSLNGKLVLDETKLDEKLSSDLVGVKKLLGAVSGTSGYAQKLESLIDPLTKTDGDMEARIDSADAEMKRLSDRMAQMEIRVAQKERRLTMQFTAMEQRLGNFNAQGAWLSGQLAGL
jgi:flagellar hook-associated protein 2